MEAGVGRDLTRGEADVAHSHGEGLAATRWSAEQRLLGHLAEGSDDGHLVVWGGGGGQKIKSFVKQNPQNYNLNYVLTISGLLCDVKTSPFADLHTSVEVYYYYYSSQNDTI